MSTVRNLALGALMLVGVAGVSAAQSTTATPSKRPDAGSYQRRGPGGRDNYMRDLNLTDAQKAQMKTIHQKYQPQEAALRTQAKPFMEAARTAHQKGDTATARTNMEKARSVMQGGQSFRAQESSEVRAILTPEQQVKYDAHQKAAADRRAEGGKKGWAHKRAGSTKK